MDLIKNMTIKAGATVLGIVIAASGALAGPLADRIAAGEPIRLGFANAAPWAYPGEDGSAKGFVNTIVLGVLARMGHTNVEPVLTDWGGLIPSVNAGRIDINTGGMYIQAARCENMDFSDPIGVFGDAFVVPVGNPKGFKTYQDIVDQNATLVVVAGYNTVGDAKNAGVPASNLMEVPGTTELLAAVISGRVDAGAINVLEAERVNELSDKVEMTDPLAFPAELRRPVGVGFHPDNADFREAFNAAMKDYMGSDEMMQAVAPDNYTAALLPGDASTEEACKAF